MILFWIILSAVIYLILFTILFLFFFSLEKDVIDFSTTKDKVFLRCMCCRQEVIVDKERCVIGDGKTFAAKCPLCGGVMTNDVLLWNYVVKGEIKENENRD